jgi:hypothetical protein
VKRGSKHIIFSGIAVTIALGILGSLAKQPWHDEIYTLYLAKLSFSEILSALADDSGPPGYYLLCRLVVLLGGDSVLSLRFLSVTAAGLTTWLLIRLAIQRGARSGLVGALLFAAHPLLFFMSCDARAYALIALCGVGTLHLFDRELDIPRAAMLSAVLAASCWLHSLGLVLTGAVFIASSSLPQKARIRAWIACLAAMLFHLPWVPIMIRQPSESLRWMADAIDQAPAWKRWLLPLTQTSPAASFYPWTDLARVPVYVEIAGLLLWIGLLALGLARIRDALRPLLLWVAASSVLVMVTSLFRPVYFPNRSESIVLGAVVLIASLGAVGKKHGPLLAASLLAGAALSIDAVSILHWQRRPPANELEIATSIRELISPDDVVVTTGWWLLTVHHALGDEAANYHWMTFPANALRHPGWYSDRIVARRPGSVYTVRRSINKQVAAGHSIWLLRTPALPSNQLLEPLVRRLGLVPRASERGLWELWGPRPTTSSTRRQ